MPANDLMFVARNAQALRESGAFEAALVEAFTSTPHHNGDWQGKALHELFKSADLQRLREVGPLPYRGPYRVFRGVSGYGADRREDHGSWTDVLGCACWYALRYGLPDPAVLVAEVREDEVFCYWGPEAEFICWPASYRRLPLSAEQIDQHFKNLEAKAEKGKNMVKKTSKSKTKTITPADPLPTVGYAATLGSASLVEQLSVLIDLAAIVNEGLKHVQSKLLENK